MNENFLSDFGINHENERVEFNKDTGEYKLCGKAEVGSFAYNLLAEAYQMQCLEDKAVKGDLTEEDTAEVLKILEKILGSDIPKVRGAIRDVENSIPKSFLPILSEEEEFFMNDTKEIDNHPWVVESKKDRKKIHVFADFIDYNTYDKKKVLDFFISEGNSAEELNLRDRFMAYCVLYFNMFEDFDNAAIFKAAAKAIDHEIEISYPKNREYCTYRIMLKDRKTGEVSIIYFK